MTYPKIRVKCTDQAQDQEDVDVLVVFDTTLILVEGQGLRLFYKQADRELKYSAGVF